MENKDKIDYLYDEPIPKLKEEEKLRKKVLDKKKSNPYLILIGAICFIVTIIIFYNSSNTSYKKTNELIEKTYTALTEKLNIANLTKENLKIDWNVKTDLTEYKDLESLKYTLLYEPTENEAFNANLVVQKEDTSLLDMSFTFNSTKNIYTRVNSYSKLIYHIGQFDCLTNPFGLVNEYLQEIKYALEDTTPSTGTDTLTYKGKTYHTSITSYTLTKEQLENISKDSLKTSNNEGLNSIIDKFNIENNTTISVYEDKETNEIIKIKLEQSNGAILEINLFDQNWSVLYTEKNNETSYIQLEKKETSIEITGNIESYEFNCTISLENNTISIKVTYSKNGQANYINLIGIITKENQNLQEINEESSIEYSTLSTNDFSTIYNSLKGTSLYTLLGSKSLTPYEELIQSAKDSIKIANLVYTESKTNINLQNNLVIKDFKDESNTYTYVCMPIKVIQNNNYIVNTKLTSGMIESFYGEDKEYQLVTITDDTYYLVNQSKKQLENNTYSFATNKITETTTCDTSITQETLLERLTYAQSDTTLNDTPFTCTNCIQ